MSDWEGLLKKTRQVLGGLPDRRTGRNRVYSMEDIALGSFSVFFTQSPSFLAHQRTIQQAKGCSNAQSLFHVERIGDDLYAHQPFCRQTLLHDFHFIFVCKPESHQTLYNWVNLLELGRDLHFRTRAFVDGFSLAAAETPAANKAIPFPA